MNIECTDCYGAGNSALTVSLIARDNDFIVVDKPAGLPSVPLRESDEHTALSQIIRLAPEAAFVCGAKKAEGGLVHRLDTATRGLLLAARTQAAFDDFRLQQKKGRFIKYYCAYCGKDACTSDFLHRRFKEKTPLIIESLFRPYGKGGKKVRPVFDGAGKADLKKAGKKIYRTEILSVEEAQTTEGIPALKVFCKIASGYRHQVRAHLASCGLPVIGDVLYNCTCASFCENVQAGGLQQWNFDKTAEPKLLFTACALEFDHPVNGKRLRFVLTDILPE